MTEGLSECPASGTPYLYADTDDSRYIIKARCKRWNCPYCGKVNAHQHYIRILNGINELSNREQQFSFVTLTSHERNKTTESCLRVWRDAWRKLRERLRRFHESITEYPLAFVYTTEYHKDGRLHWHMLVNNQADSRWYKDNARECGLGYQAKSVPVDNAAQATNYVTKYLAKSLSQTDYPKKMRRVNYSQTFPDKPQPDAMYQWELLQAKESITSVIESGWKKDLSTYLNWTEITEIVYD